MRKLFTIQNIEAMRRREGIDDVELRRQIRALHVGDSVRVTLLCDATAETLLVRITSIKEAGFRGKLLIDPRQSGFAELHSGSALAFTVDEIHSVPNESRSYRKPTQESSSASALPS